MILDEMLQDIRQRAAAQRERDELARSGEALAAFRERDPLVGADQLPDAVRLLRRRVDALTEALDQSLEADRADYASVSPAMRLIVIVRGLCTRAILRHQRQRCYTNLRPFYEELGAAAGKGLGRRVDKPQTSTADDQRPQDVWKGRLAAEARLLGKALKRQLLDRLFPRLPALAGLIAGWWVANTYTDSHWKSALRSVGIGDGGTHVVSGEMYHLLVVGLPILSAAVCAYLGDRLAHVIRSRYAAAKPPPGIVPEESES